MPTTPTYGLPWPLGTDTPDVPRDVQALAEATETALGQVADLDQAYSRGIFATQSVGNGVEATLAPTVSSAAVVTMAASTFTLARPGFYAIGMTLFTATGVSSGVRMFISIKGPSSQTGQGLTSTARSSFGFEENQQGTSGVYYSDGTGQVQFTCYQNTGASLSFSGNFTIKHIGA